MTYAIILTLTLSISAYTPQANRISGGAVMANGRAPHVGAFACPARERARRLGLPVDGVCADRFHRRFGAGHLDICIPRGFEAMTDAQRLQRAFAWGRMRGDVVFTLPEDIHD